MKLYSQDESPYSVPVRAAIYAKGLDIAIEPPPGGLQSETYKAASLTGTVPCLILDDGTRLPESSVILEYLEDRFPETPLRPKGLEARAHEALIRRIVEGRLLAAIVQLFHAMSDGRPEEVKAEVLAQLERGLGQLDQLVAVQGFAAGEAFTLADCYLAPTLMGVALVAPMLGRPSLIADHPKIAAYMPRGMSHPAIGRVLAEMQAAVAGSGFSFS